MAILFRCPCGRSMVAESDKAGSVIVCPNCQRNLRVPSGKGRGKELTAAPAAQGQSIRECERCGESIPIDAQMCPFCKAIQMIGSGDPAPVAKAAGGGAAKPAAARRGPALGKVDIRYGGARGGWWAQLSPGGRAGVIAGIAGFALLVIILLAIVGVSGSGRQLVDGRERAMGALDQGEQLEAEGRFQEAYNTYYSGLVNEKYLRGSGDPADAGLADRLWTRIEALKYLVPEPKTREPVHWRPANQQELDDANRQVVAMYPTYRQRGRSVTAAVMAAVESGRAGDQARFQADAKRVMGAFRQFVRDTTPQQRATYTFDSLMEAVKAVAMANRRWDYRGGYLDQAEGYVAAFEERVAEPPGTPQGDKIR